MMTPQDSNDIQGQKKALRREMLGVLSAIPADGRRAADGQIRRLVKEMPQYKQAGRLFIFIGAGWEVDTRPLVEEALAAGKQVTVPRCLPASPADKAAGGLMEACLIRSLSDLRPVPPMGLWEPAAGTPVLSPSEIDFAVIPCIACDREGYRLGRGGGYYDRFLRGNRFVKAAVCRQALLRDALPSEAFDERVDFVITEAGLYVCTKKE